MDEQRKGRCISRRAALCAGLGLLGTALASRAADAAEASGFMGILGAVAAVAAPRATYPDRIVNGDFSYPGLSTLVKLRPDKLSVNGDRDVYLDPVTGKFTFTSDYLNYGNHGNFIAIPGFDSDKFGWRSNQGFVDDGIHYVPAGTVQFNFSVSGNPFGEISIHSYGRYLYQDIATVPDSVYAWSLKHCSYAKQVVDTMQVKIGAPGRETACRARRTTVNGNGDKIGDVGTLIGTKSSNGLSGDSYGPWRNDDQWETYTGRYYVPEGQTVTRFTFEGVDAQSATAGNNIDNVSFEIAYPLYYDANGGEGTFPDPKDGDYDGYNAAKTKLKVTTVKPTRAGHTFLGWSETKTEVVHSEKGLEGVDIIASGGSFTQPAASVTLYAVWGKNPTVTTYVVGRDGRATKVGYKAVAFGSVLDVSADSWVASQLEQAAVKAGAPKDYVVGWWLAAACEGDEAGKLTVYEDVDLYAKVICDDVDVVKVWEGGETVRPDAVTVTLIGSDKTKRTLSIKETAGWCGVFGNVPMETAAGASIAYELTEDEVEGFTTDITGTAEDGFTVMNTYVVPKIDIPVEKRWVDGEDALFTIKTVTVTLHGSDGSERRLRLTAADGWKGVFEDVPERESDGSVIEYSVSEDMTAAGGYRLPDYDTAIEGSAADGFTITNTYVVPTMDVPVSKTWTESGSDAWRPGSVTVRLRGSDGSERSMALSAGNGWKGVFEDVPETTRRGSVIAYTLVEDAVANYDAKVTGDAESGFEVTNALKTGRTDFDKDARYGGWL